LHQEVGDNVISFLREAFPRKFSGIKTIPTTETEIKITVTCLESRRDTSMETLQETVA
jgi:hypothetical protein